MIKVIEHIINIDLARTLNINKSITIKKNDTKSHKFVINIFDNSLEYDLTNDNARIYFQKADTNKVFADCKIDDATKGKISYVLDTQCVSCVGKVETEITIYGTNKEILTSVTFNFNVSNVLRDDLAIESTSEFTALTNALNKIDIAVENIGVIDELNTILEGNITTGNTTNTNVKASTALGNITDINLKADISTGNATDTKIKASISLGNTLDTNLKADISAGNITDTNLKADVATGNTLYTNLNKNITDGNALDITLKTDITACNTTNTNVKASTVLGNTTDTNLKADIIIAKGTQFATEISNARNGEANLGVRLGKVDSELAKIDAKMKQNADNIVNTKLGINRQALINGNFDVWQRGTDFTTAGYTADRWTDTHAPSTRTHRTPCTVGQTAIPNNPNYFMEIERTAVVSTINGWLSQKIETVLTFAGTNCTLSFYASGTVGKVLGVQLVQNFGAGGSAQLAASNQAFTLGAWQKYVFTFDVPNIAGKTIGSNSSLQLTFNEVTAFSTFTIEIASIQLNQGDTALPFSPKNCGEELLACQRYYEIGSFGTQAYHVAGSLPFVIFEFKVTKRVNPICTTAVFYSYNVTGVGVSRVDTDSLRINCAVVNSNTSTFEGNWTADAEL